MSLCFSCCSLARPPLLACSLTTHQQSSFLASGWPVKVYNNNTCRCLSFFSNGDDDDGNLAGRRRREQRRRKLLDLAAPIQRACSPVACTSFGQRHRRGRCLRILSARQSVGSSNFCCLVSQLVLSHETTLSVSFAGKQASEPAAQLLVGKRQRGKRVAAALSARNWFAAAVGFATAGARAAVSD